MVKISYHFPSFLKMERITMRGRRRRSFFDRPDVFCAVDALSSVHSFAPFLNLAQESCMKLAENPNN